MANRKPVVPDADIRELRKDHKALLKAEPSPEHAAELAAFVRRAHEMRQLNMAMHTGQMCLDEDPDDPDLLVSAYLVDREDLEDGLRDLLDLADLGRYLDRDDVVVLAEDRFDDRAATWIGDATDAEQRYRLRILTAMKDRAYADNLRDADRF